MTHEERRQLISRYARGPELVERALSAAPPGAFHFRPFADAWTIAEHVNHLCDAEFHTFIRYRLAIAEPGSKIRPFDEGRWVSALNYDQQSVEASMGLFTSIRALAAAHLRAIVDADWSGYYYDHSVQGNVTLERWLAIYTDHTDEHVDYINRNVRLFNQGQASVAAVSPSR